MKDGSNGVDLMDIEAAVAEQLNELGDLLRVVAEARKQKVEWNKAALPVTDREEQAKLQKSKFFGWSVGDIDRYYIPRIANAIAALSGGGK